MAASRYIEWTQIRPGMCVELKGKPGAQHYVAHVTKRRRAVVIWESRYAREAQRFLNARARSGAYCKR